MPSTNFTGLIFTSSPNIAYSPVCKKDRDPPVRSKMILAIDHPFVDFLL